MKSNCLAFVFCVLLVNFVHQTTCEVVTFQACPEQVGNCVVHEVRINPCPESAQNVPCLLKRGSSAEISFDFTSDFASDNTKSEVFWAKPGLDLPLLGMDRDACKFTKCPFAANQKQTYTNILPIEKKYKTATYDIKWKLYNDQDDKHLCCFTTQIAVVKSTKKKN